jgi:hypothetical protein
MNTKQTHTPAPWKLGSELLHQIRNANGQLIADVWSQADADFIVKAVNMHGELIEASKKVIEALHDRFMRTGVNTIEATAMKRLREAIAKASA